MEMKDRKFSSTAIKLRRLLVAVLAVIAAAMCLFALAACDDKGQISEEEKRTQAVEAFEKNALAAFNESWAPDMPREEVAKLADCGSYVETCLWLESMGNMLYDSSLQTAKINIIADFAASEEGKALVRNASENMSAAFDFVDAVGFTSADASETGFLLLRTVTKDVARIYRSAETELNELLRYVVGSGRNNIYEALDRVDRVLATDFSDEETVSEALAALDGAESGIKTLVAFMYDTERTFGSGSAGDNLGSLLEGISTGALNDISDAELFVWLDSLVKSVREFGSDMTAETITQIKTAIASVESCFEGFVQPVDVVDEVLEWLNYVGAFADEIPDAVNYVVSALDVLYEKGSDGAYTYSFVGKLKRYAAEEDGRIKELNSYVLSAGLLSSFAQSVGAEELKDKMQELAESGNSDKRLVLYLSVMLCCATDGQPTYITQDDYVDMAVYAFSEVFVSAFESAYRDYVLNPEKYERRVRNWAGVVLSFAKSMNDILVERGEEPVKITVTNEGEITAEWKDEVLQTARDVSDRMAADTGDGSLPQKAVTEISGHIDAMYAGMSEIEELAGMSYITDSNGESAARVSEIVESNPVMYLLSALFA